MRLPIRTRYREVRIAEPDRLRHGRRHLLQSSQELDFEPVFRRFEYHYDDRSIESGKRLAGSTLPTATDKPDLLDKQVLGPLASAVTGRLPTEHLKQIPQPRALRERLRRRAAAAVERLDRTRRLDRQEFELLARRVVSDLGLPECFVGWTMVTVASAFWEPRVASVAPPQRLLLLPAILADGLDRDPVHANSMRGRHHPLASACQGAWLSSVAGRRIPSRFWRRSKRATSRHWSAWRRWMCWRRHWIRFCCSICLAWHSVVGFGVGRSERRRCNWPGCGLGS